MVDDEQNSPTIPPGSTQSWPIPLTPKQIGPYEITGLLEKGGMSLLYLGTHPDTNEPTTIKVLSSKYLSNTEIVERFLKEAEIIALADHPHIVKLFGYGEWEGGLYIAMEYIEGVSLRQYLMQTPLSLKRSLEFVIDIAYAICHLHRHGVIHRDLKPENILVTNKNFIKVIDFGIAQLLTEKDEHQQSYRQKFIGTPIYMSPEQRDNPESVTFASDIYSLGIITYELVLGKLSHGQIHIGLMPKGLQKILIKALQPDPKNRYQDIVDFIFDLNAYLQSPAFEKERKMRDQLSEFTEDLRQTQSFLISEIKPKWPKEEVGTAVYKSLQVTNLVQDFFQLKDNIYGLMIGESSSKNVEGFYYSAFIKGVIRSLAFLQKNTRELFHHFHELIYEDKPESFSLSFVLFEENENEIYALTQENSHIWYLENNKKELKKITTFSNNRVDSSLLEYHIPWNAGDRLIIANYPSTKEIVHELNENILLQQLNTHLDLSPQQLVDATLRYLRVFSKIKNFSISLICIKKTI